MLRKAKKGTKQNPKRQAILRTANPLPVLKITAPVFRIKKNGSQFEITVITLPEKVKVFAVKSKISYLFD